jgi:hypothetical protein
MVRPSKTGDLKSCPWDAKPGSAIERRHFMRRSRGAKALGPMRVVARTLGLSYELLPWKLHSFD